MVAFGCCQILIGGRHVFMGYLNDGGSTSSAIDTDGFFSTGDVGHIDKSGFVYITGRSKVPYYLSQFSVDKHFLVSRCRKL